MPVPGWPSLTNDSGDGQSGTVLQKSVFDSIEDSIEGVAFGTINTTIPASTIIDEVVAARGTELTLDARLSEALAADGELNPFSPQPTFKPGSASAADGTVGGGVNAQFSAVGNSGGAETQLMAYTIQANHMDTNAKVIRFTAWGSFASNANSKMLRIQLGGVTVLERTLAAGPRYWHISGLIIRTTSTAGKVHSLIFIGAQTETNIDTNRVQNASVTPTWSSSQVLRVTGTGVASNDIVQDGFLVEAVN